MKRLKGINLADKMFFGGMLLVNINLLDWLKFNYILVLGVELIILSLLLCIGNKDNNKVKDIEDETVNRAYPQKGVDY